MYEKEDFHGVSGTPSSSSIMAEIVGGMRGRVGGPRGGGGARGGARGGGVRRGRVVVRPGAMHFAEAGRRAPVLTRGRYTGNLVVVQPGDVEYPYNIEHQLSSVEEPIATPSYDDAPSYDGVQRKKKATILGGYDPAKEIKRALAQSIFACYQRAQAREGVQGGKLSVRFTILPNGRVSNFQFVEDSLNSPSVARCVRAMLSNYVFAAPERPQVVTFPFLFS